MANLKPSSYNFLIPQADQSYVLYNSAHGHITRLDNATGRAVTWLLQHPNHASTLGANLGRLKDDLVRDAFLVTEAHDELQALRERYQTERNAVRGLNLTIAVTLACNFRCSYCSQDRDLRHMSVQAADQLLQFVQRMLPDGTGLSVTWYGGEPLLNRPVLDRLSRGFLDICAEKRAAYSASMITNGYRLNAATAAELAELGIRDFQITVDGDRDVHNKNRPLLGGQGTYDTILRNIREVLPHVGDIALRINVLRSTMRAAAETYRQLSQMSQEHRNLRPYLARVFDSDDSCIAADDILPVDEFARLVEQLDASADVDAASDLVAPPIDNICGADRTDSFVVDPAGQLFKCWNSVGRGDECIGNVATYTPKPNAWLQFDPTEDPECRACKFLPICLGGCLDTRFKGRNGDKDCAQEKFVMQERLAKWARSTAKNPPLPS